MYVDLVRAVDCCWGRIGCANNEHNHVQYSIVTKMSPPNDIAFGDKCKILDSVPLRSTSHITLIIYSRLFFDLIAFKSHAAHKHSVFEAVNARFPQSDYTLRGTQRSFSLFRLVAPPQPHHQKPDRNDFNSKWIAACVRSLCSRCL